MKIPSSTGSFRVIHHRIGFILLLFLLGLAACHQKRGEIYHIPQKADFVVAMDMQSMALKSLNFKELLNLDFFLRKRTPEETAIAERIQNSGIDLLGTAYLFIQMPDSSIQPDDTLQHPEITILVPIKNEEQFESFLKQEKGQPAGEAEGLKFFATDSLLVGCNQKTAFVTIRQETPVDVLKKRLLDLQNLPADHSLVENNDYFDQLREKSFDMLFWADASKANRATSALPGAMSLKDNYVGAVLNFEKGEAVFDGNFVTHNQALGKYDDLMDVKADKDLINNIPTQSPIGAFAMKLNLGTVKKILKDNNLLAGANQTVQMLGMSAEELLDMLSGDLVVSVVNAPDSGASIPEMYVCLGIANQNSLQKLIRNFKNQGFLTDEGQYLGLSFVPSLALIPEDGKLAVATSPALRESVLSGKESPLNEAAATSLKEGALSFYLDYDVLAGKDTLSKRSAETRLMSHYLEAFKLNAIQTSKTATDGKFIVTFKDKDQNSLVTLTKMGKELNDLRAKRAAEQQANEVSATDSTKIQ